MERWTSREEAELQRLMKRKAELNAKNMEPLLALVRREDLQGNGNADIAEILMANADEFRDALEPFDSGVRVAPSNSE